MDWMRFLGRSVFPLACAMISLGGCDQLGQMPQSSAVTAVSTSPASPSGGVAPSTVAATSSSGNFTVGTAPGNVVQLDSGGKLPSVDGSALQGVRAAQVGGLAAADVAMGASLANEATSANTFGSIVRRDATTGDVSVSRVNATALTVTSTVTAVDVNASGNLAARNVAVSDAISAKSGAVSESFSAKAVTVSDSLNAKAIVATTLQGALTGNASTADYALGRAATTATAGPNVAICSDGSYTAITGSGDIASFAEMPAGVECTVSFQESGPGSPTAQLTSTGNILLSGGGTFQTANNDVFVFLSLPQNRWKEIRRVTTKESRVFGQQANTSEVATGNSSPAPVVVIPLQIDTVGASDNTQLEFQQEGTGSTAVRSFTPKQDGVYHIAVTASLLNNVRGLLRTDGGCVNLEVITPGAPNIVHALGYECPRPGQYVQVSANASVFLRAQTRVVLQLRFSNYPAGSAEIIYQNTVNIARIH